MSDRLQMSRIGGLGSGLAAQPKPVKSDPSRWPVLVRWLARHKAPGDLGAGDTVERLLKHVAADKAAHIYERLAGKSCGCENRKNWLNARYRY